MRPQAGVDRLKPVPPMHANDLPIGGAGGFACVPPFFSTPAGGGARRCPRLWHQACTPYRFSRLYGSSQKAVTVSAGGCGDVIDRKPAAWSDYGLKSQSRQTNHPPPRGTAAGYFCHRDGRGDTERANLANRLLRRLRDWVFPLLSKSKEGKRAMRC